MCLPLGATTELWSHRVQHVVFCLLIIVHHQNQVFLVVQPREKSSIRSLAMAPKMLALDVTPRML